MKHSISILIIVMFMTVAYAQDQPETYMYETIYLTPDLEDLAKLQETMAAHNKKYHGPGDHAAFVQRVVAGKRTGDLVWVMGPGKFAHLDSRPAEGGHDEDWANNVLPNLEEMSVAEYWRRDATSYYVPEGYTPGKIRVRFYKVKRGEGSNLAEHYSKLIQVFREKNYNRALSIYHNTFPTAHGRNIASVSSFNNWAELDEGIPIENDFNSIHGEGSWGKWLEGLRELTEWSDQEVRELMPGLSGTD